MMTAFWANSQLEERPLPFFWIRLQLPHLAYAVEASYNLYFARVATAFVVRFLLSHLEVFAGEADVRNLVSFGLEQFL